MIPMRILLACAIGIFALCDTPQSPAQQTHSVDHASHHHHDHEHEIHLPVERIGNTTRSTPMTWAHNADQWKIFTATYGAWTAVIDKATQTPHRAFGPAIQIEGYSKITAENVEAAAQQFLQRHSGVMNIEVRNLKLVRTTLVNNRWYVTYRQVERGVEVLLSEVELRIFANGKVMAFGADYYHNITVDLEPTLTYEQAKLQAVAGMNDGAVKYSAMTSAGLQAESSVYILPIKRAGSVEYKLTYRVPVASSTGIERYTSYVDAHKGGVVWRKSGAYNIASTISASGAVKPDLPNREAVERAFPYQYITVNGERHTTDVNGNLEIDIDQTANVSATLEGPWINLTSQGQQEATFSGTLEPGSDLAIAWNDENSHLYQRNIFYYAQIIRDWFKLIDPDMTTMDFPLNVTINFNAAQANASSGGRDIRFEIASNGGPGGGPAPDVAGGGGVFYHEYGHSVNTLLAEELGGTFNNATCQEGMADVTAAMIMDDPRIGFGVFADDTTRTIRELENDFVYPDDLDQDPHISGQILAGAFWDLRTSVSLEYARSISHFARYGLPDDPDDGVAFGEWFLETIIADDDDGDLSNGTPHIVEIVSAFNRHNIGTNLIINSAFSHTPLENTVDTLNPYPVTFELTIEAVFGQPINEITLVYSFDEFTTSQEVNITANAEREFVAAIPAQKAGTVVQYYVQFTDPLSQETIKYGSGSGSFKPFDFLVGFRPVVVDAMESGSGWQLGGNGDNANAGGAWEFGDPDVVDLSQFGFGGIIQPEDDHSENGSLCLVTGADAGQDFFSGAIISGRTTAQTPVYDLSRLERPIIEFYHWFHNVLPPIPGFEVDPSVFTVEYSIDGGVGWETVHETTENTDEWEKLRIIVPESALGAEQFRMRFVVDNPGDPNFPGALTEALVDDFEILDPSQEIVSVAEHLLKLDDGQWLSVSPNPFTDGITVKYRLASKTSVKASVHDLSGRTVQVLRNEMQIPGEYSMHWSGTTSALEQAGPGVYIIRIQVGETVMTRSVVKF